MKEIEDKTSKKEKRRWCGKCFRFRTHAYHPVETKKFLLAGAPPATVILHWRCQECGTYKESLC